MFDVDRALLREAASRFASAHGLRWVIGGACSGKTALCRTISHWTGVPVYDMDEHVYGRFMGRYDARRHPASSAWLGRGDGLAWALSLPWEAFDHLNRATNVEFRDLVARDVADRFGERPVLVDGGITHPSVLAVAVDPTRIACLSVATAATRRIWETDEARAAMRTAIERLPGRADRWTTFLAFDERMRATIEREAREEGVAMFARAPGVSVEQLSSAVMRGLGIVGDGEVVSARPDRDRSGPRR